MSSFPSSKKRKLLLAEGESLKYKDEFYNTQFTTDWTVMSPLFTRIEQGTAYNERIGTKVTICSIAIRGYIYYNGEDNGAHPTLALVLDTQSEPNAAQVFTPQLLGRRSYSFQDPTYSKRYKILFRKMYPVSQGAFRRPNGSAVIEPIELYFNNLNIVVDVNDELLSQGTPTIYLVGVSNLGFDNTNLRFNSRVIFKDC